MKLKEGEKMKFIGLSLGFWMLIVILYTAVDALLVYVDSALTANPDVARAAKRIIVNLGMIVGILLVIIYFWLVWDDIKWFLGKVLVCIWKNRGKVTFVEYCLMAYLIVRTFMKKRRFRVHLLLAAMHVAMVNGIWDHPFQDLGEVQELMVTLSWDLAVTYLVVTGIYMLALAADRAERQ